MAKKNFFLVYDWETGSANPNTCQPVQLGAIIVDSIRLEVVNGSEFNSYIQPVFDDEKCVELGIAPLEDEALKVNNLTREQLQDAPGVETVWKNFTDYVANYSAKKGKWGAPMRVGYNNYRFDDIITDRLCKQYGQWDKDRDEQNLFFPSVNVDVMRNFMWPWTENMEDIKSLSLDAVRAWMGYSADNAHDALDDVKITADLLIRFLKLHRHFSPKVKFA